MKKKTNKVAKYLHYTAVIILLVVAAFWFIFALLSGAEAYGGGLKGILMNSPNALPWLLLLAFVYVSWKCRLVGGIIITLAGICTIFAFDTFESIFSFLFISLPITLLGIILIVSWYLTRK